MGSCRWTHPYKEHVHIYSIELQVHSSHAEGCEWSMQCIRDSMFVSHFWPWMNLWWRVRSAKDMYISLSAFGLCLTFLALFSVHIHVRDWSCTWECDLYLPLSDLSDVMRVKVLEREYFMCEMCQIIIPRWSATAEFKVYLLTINLEGNYPPPSLYLSTAISGFYLEKYFWGGSSCLCYQVQWLTTAANTY